MILRVVSSRNIRSAIKSGGRISKRDASWGLQEASLRAILALSSWTRSRIHTHFRSSPALSVGRDSQCGSERVSCSLIASNANRALKADPWFLLGLRDIIAGLFSVHILGQLNHLCHCPIFPVHLLQAASKFRRPESELILNVHEFISHCKHHDALLGSIPHQTVISVQGRQ